jgi:hypothetical protein
MLERWRVHELEPTSDILNLLGRATQGTRVLPGKGKEEYLYCMREKPSDNSFSSDRLRLKIRLPSLSTRGADFKQILISGTALKARERL